MTSSNEPEIWVIFDTSVIYTKSEYYIMNEACNNLIEEYKSSKGIKISWFIPKVVIDERNFQMIQAVHSLLPSVQKLGKLLGHDLYTKTLILDSIKHNIDAQIDNGNIKLIELDTNAIDWNRLICKAFYRKPPFIDVSQGEKGFRDAIIIEAMLQQADKASKPVTRVVLVVNDGLMKDSISARLNCKQIIRVASNIEELRTILNTHRSDISEELMNIFLPKAKLYFFSNENGVNKGLYIKEDIHARLQARFSNKLDELPPAASVSRENVKWLVGNPQFLARENQRLFWSTSITVLAEAYIFEPTPPLGYSLSGGSNAAGAVPAWIANSICSSTQVHYFDGERSSDVESTNFLFSDNKILEYKDTTYKTIKHKRILYIGKSVFNVEWSTIISEENDIVEGRIDDLKFVDTTWERVDHEISISG